MQERTKKIPAKELYKRKVQVNKKTKDIKLLVICSEISHTQIPHHVATSQLDFDKNQINAKRETLEQGISEQTPVIKVNKCELKWYSNYGKTHAKL